MKLPRGGTNILLIVLFICAVWLRVDSLGDPVYPYFKGESGTNFRQTVHIAGRGSLPELDKRASWPEGFSPSRVKANGVEYFAGFVYRLVKPFSDVTEKRFVNLLTIFFFSLSVFILYALTNRLWTCQAAGLWAAFLVAFSAPLITATNGSDYFHDTFAFVIISFQLLMAIETVQRPSLLRVLLSGVSAFLLFAVWEQTGFYVAVFCLMWGCVPGIEISARRRILLSLLAAAVLAGLAFPHLRAQRFLFTWPAILVAVTAAWMVSRDKLPAKIPGWAVAAGVFVLLVVIFRPFASGGSDLVSPLSYWFYRLRFIAGKPDDPLLLPESIRTYWSYSHASPSMFVVFAVFFPLAFLVVPAVSALRAIQRDGKWHVFTTLALAVGAVALFLIDRRAILAVSLVVFPFVSIAFRGFSGALKTRLFPAAIAALIVATSLPFTARTVNTTSSVGRLLGISPTGGDFAWVSVGNADIDMARFLVSRTSTRRDIFLAAPEIASLIPTFAGRATILAPGIHTTEMAKKTVDALAAFYGDEKGLYALCEALGATHVLYSIDILLDSSKNSPRYTAGAEQISETAVAFRMHFAPEGLRHFQLVYENDNFRLFRVTEEINPVFITDHPPVYQMGILGVHGDTLDSFYARIVDLLSTYQTAVNAQANGDEKGAISRLRYCLDQAPVFTDAWLRVGDSLLRLGRPDDAFDAYNRVLQYAPDNKHALFYGALSLGYGDRNEQAIRLLELLLNSTADREIRLQAEELKRTLESGQRIEIPKQTPRTEG